MRGAAALLTLAGLAAFGTASSARGEPAATGECRASAKEIVTGFYNRALVHRDVRGGFEAFMAPDFIEHKPDIPTGDREGTIRGLEGQIRAFPEARWEIVRVVAEGDLVAVHARSTLVPGAPPFAVADFFRVEDCRIIEHWDVVAGPVEGAKNPHSRF